jgi:hypothetical protein
LLRLRILSIFLRAHGVEGCFVEILVLDRACFALGWVSFGVVRGDDSPVNWEDWEEGQGDCTE